MGTIVVHGEKDKLKILKGIIKVLGLAFEETKAEKIPPHVLDSIKRGRDDSKAGRSITLDQFAERMSAKL